MSEKTEPSKFDRNGLVSTDFIRTLAIRKRENERMRTYRMSRDGTVEFPDQVPVALPPRV